MTIYNINNLNEWISLMNTTFISGDIINLLDDITINSLITLTIPINVTFDGNHNTITNNYTKGIFVMKGGTVNNLTIDGNNKQFNTKESPLCNYYYGGNYQYGTFYKCHVINANLGTKSGGIGGYMFGHATIPSYIICCKSDVHINDDGGGFIGNRAQNVNIYYSFYNGSIDVHSEYVGSIIGTDAGYNGSTINIVGCYVNSNLFYNCGGVCATSYPDSTINISQCYVLGDIDSWYNCGGFISIVKGTVNITDCYIKGDILKEGGIFAAEVIENSVLNITNCYHIGNDIGLIIFKHHGICNITDTILQQSENYINEGEGIINTSNISIDMNNIINCIPDNWDNENIWKLGSYPMLKVFDDDYLWDDYYGSYDGTPDVNKIIYDDPPNKFDIWWKGTMMPMIDNENYSMAMISNEMFYETMRNYSGHRIVFGPSMLPNKKYRVIITGLEYNFMCED